MSSRVKERRVPRLSIDVSHVDDPDDKHRFGRTQQSFKSECDINNIMSRFEKTGLLEHVNEFNGQYGDFTDVPIDYHAAIDQVLAADAMFQSIPAKIRARFNNDAGEFLAFVDNPANVDEMVELGLARPRPIPPDPRPGDPDVRAARSAPPEAGAAGEP